MKAESYSIQSPIRGICKSTGIWISEGNKMAPLVFFRKPKWVSDDQWLEIVNCIRIDLPKGFDVID